MIRSGLWEPGSYPAADALPSLGMMIAEEIGDIDAGEAEAKLERANTVVLWGESQRRRRVDGVDRHGFQGWPLTVGRAAECKALLRRWA